MWVNSVEQASIPKAYHALVTDSASLSARLKSKCKNLSVQLHLQTLARAFADEQDLLAIQEPHSLIRKTCLLGDDQPWIQARIVVPHRSYLNWKCDFDNLGTKLLGETLLYQRPGLKRSAFQFAQFNDQVWGRRSIFSIDTDQVLVTEFFLPAVLAQFQHN